MSVAMKLEVKRCVDCPFSEKHQILTPDSFEFDMGVFCSKIDEIQEKHSTYDGVITKKLVFSYEWLSEINQEIPDWCPFRA